LPMGTLNLIREL